MAKRSDLILERQGIVIAFHLMQIGLDYLVVIEGGDVPHIGAISIGNAGYARNAENPMKQQLICLPGHKESVITEAMYTQLSDFSSHTICVIGGVHIENITRAQIQLVLKMCEEGGNQMAKWIAHESQPSQSSDINSGCQSQ